MASYNWFVFHNGDTRRGNVVLSGGIKLAESAITHVSLVFLTNSVASAVTRSFQLELARLVPDVKDSVTYLLCSDARCVFMGIGFDATGLGSLVIRVAHV